MVPTQKLFKISFSMSPFLYLFIFSYQLQQPYQRQKPEKNEENKQ